MNVKGELDISSSEESDGDDEEDATNIDYKTYMKQKEMPPDFWHVQKLIRYLTIGNQTATVLALCNLADHDLDQEFVQVRIVNYKSTMATIEP